MPLGSVFFKDLQKFASEGPRMRKICMPGAEIALRATFGNLQLLTKRVWQLAIAEATCGALLDGLQLRVLKPFVAQSLAACSCEC